MSYRTFKRLLGETSLERKCRFLFGGGLFLLIIGSFYFNWRQTSKAVYEQNIITGRLLVAPIILEKHWKDFSLKSIDFTDQEFSRVIGQFANELKPPDLKDYKYDLFNPNSTDPEKRAGDQADWGAIHELQADTSLREWVRPLVVNKESGREYHYYSAVRAVKSCVGCHQHSQFAENDLLGVVKISFPLDPIERALAWNKAILVATAIVTAFLAVIALYALVRYVIVKPVLHLKDVSDAISRGNLELRADIRTGDEFEELSQAFNRMLRHLVAVQEELRQVNATLDGKVDELAQANMRLYELNNLKNDFLATMTHELRTPLNSILGFSDVLAGVESLDEKQQRYVRNIQTSGRDLLTLINDILDLAKIESGKMDLHIIEFSIEDLIERLVSSVRPLAEKRNIDLSSFVDPRLPPLTQDAGKIQQILYNLLSNAIKFTPEGGRVQVTAMRHEETELELIVEDTGVGIPLEDQETIFEKFRQGNTVPGSRNSTLTREYAGTGLGLSIVKELSKLLGGEVTVRSELGKGSAFTVRVPLVLKEQPRPLTEVLAGSVLEAAQLKRLDSTLLPVTKTLNT